MVFIFHQDLLDANYKDLILEILRSMLGQQLRLFLLGSNKSKTLSISMSFINDEDVTKLISEKIA